MAAQVRPFRPADAPRLAEIVQRCLREVNSRDYPAAIIDKMCAHFTAERFADLSSQRRIFVAAAGDVVHGTVSLDGNKVFTMFVDPDQAGRGIGRRLMEHIETVAAHDGYDHMETGASITAHDFYRTLGYTDIRESETEFGLNYILRKPLTNGAVAPQGLAARRVWATVEEDRRLAADIVGDSGPVVVYVGGTGDNSLESFEQAASVLADMTPIGRVRAVQQVFYSRPGTDDSDPCDADVRTFTEVAEELHAVLTALAVPGPFVLAGHSIGGLIIDAYAHAYPEHTAGLVLVDASAPNLMLSMGRNRVADGDNPGTVAFQIDPRPESMPTTPPTFPVHVVSSRVERWGDLTDEAMSKWFPGLTREELASQWQEHQDFLTQYWSGHQAVATVGGHYVQNDAPGLVAEAIAAALTTGAQTRR